MNDKSKDNWIPNHLEMQYLTGDEQQLLKKIKECNRSESIIIPFGKN